mgnify:FL=1
MKKTIILLFILISSLSFGQLDKLNEYGLAFKNADEKMYQDAYQNIKQDAIDTWDDNHLMILSQINQNAESLYTLLQQIPTLKKDEFLILIDALETWIKPSDKTKFNNLYTKAKNGDGNGNEYELFFCCKTNYLMVKSQLEQQLNAKTAY